MKEADLKEIPSKGFTKTWWQSHRSIRAKGSGVGKALDKWNAAGMPPGGNIKTLKKGTQFSAGFESIDALKKSLDVALSKVKGKAKDTEAGIKIYQKETDKHRRIFQSEYDQRLLKYQEDRKGLVKVLSLAVKELTPFVKSAKELLALSEKLEKDANDVISSGQLEQRGKALLQTADSIEKDANNTQNSMQVRYEKDAKYVKERRGSKYDADSCGVMKEDGQRLKFIFEEATKLTNDASAISREVKNLTQETVDNVREARELLTSGKRSVEDSLKMAKSVADNATKLAQKFDDEVRRGKSGFDKLEQMAANIVPVDESIRGEVKVRLTIVDQTVKRANPVFRNLKTSVDKASQRIPKEHQRERIVKPVWDRARMALMQGIRTKEAFDKQVEKAKQNAKRILQG